MNTPRSRNISSGWAASSPHGITPAEFADDIGKELVQQQAIVKKLGMVNN
ncbi:MAG: hypothetical protein IPJ18_04210 [Betaproteobacteria bacterium]|nr:hypothetical protein [Betaproteobacteria bacterium]